jgi:hypothetical protein
MLFLLQQCTLFMVLWILTLCVKSSVSNCQLLEIAFEYFQGTVMCSFQTFPDDLPSIQYQMLSIFQMSLKRQFYAFNISYKCGKNMRLEVSFSEMFQAPPCIQVNNLYHCDLLELLVHELLHQILKNVSMVKFHGIRRFVLNTNLTHH